MTIEFKQLDDQPRLLMEAELKPVQGKRFQPTGFPDLGAAVYDTPDANGDSIQMILVESAQSVANRLEDVCWDYGNNSPHSALEGMPYVDVTLWNSDKTTNSLLEAHRLNSPYIINKDKKRIDQSNFLEKLRDESGIADEKEAIPFNRSALAKAVFKYDPNSVLHGIFLEKIDGRARLQRCVSGFIEAEKTRPADSGGVKNDRVTPSTDSAKAIGVGGSNEGFTNVPYHRTEYTAQGITAYFNLDLAQIRAYGLGENAERFLITLALWKIRRFLETGLRLRTACDLDMEGDLKVTRPKEFDAPGASKLEAGLPGLIKACAADGLFADQPVTKLTFQRN